MEWHPYADEKGLHLKNPVFKLETLHLSRWKDIDVSYLMKTTETIFETEFRPLYRERWKEEVNSSVKWIIAQSVNTHSKFKVKY